MWNDHPETQELLAQARAGQTRAVERLLDVHREPLRRVIDLRLDPALAARVDASDIVQDVLLEAHKRLEEYLRNPAMPFRLWLRHIAQDHVIDAHRRHRQAQRRSLDREQPIVPAVLADHSSYELAGQLLDGERTPASEAIHRELQRKLDAAIAALDDDDREIILMRHREQLANQDVAQALGLSEAAASMRYLRHSSLANGALAQRSERGGMSMASSIVERDEQLARLLEELTDKVRQGQQPDVEGVAQQHPSLAGELRELWAAAQFAEVFARTPRSPSRSGQKATAVVADLRGRTMGDFVLLEEISRGGMGVVYKARQKSLDRIVAVKMILRGEHATAADLARFQIEAQAAAGIEHPNIVPVYASGVQEGQAYFCMRFVEGETLSALLSRGPLRPKDAAAVLAIISRAVDYAHQRGILHRDLKPSNILLERATDTSQGDLPFVPMVTDFGLAKRARTDATEGDSLTHSGVIVGTPAYMAPEQVSGSRGTPSPASDVYSLGVILYEMLTGRPPFQAPTPVDTLLLVLDQDPVRPGMLNPKVDPDLELICLKCIQKEPELRYASAEELATDLEAYQRGDQLSIHRTQLVDLGNFFGRLFRETHHAVVLENWGVLWMCHSLKIFLQCVLTTALSWSGVINPFIYLLLWGGGLIIWGMIFWSLRKRAGPVLFVERQIAHVWAAAIMGTISVFVLEIVMNKPVLELAPLLAVIAGMTFVVKGGMLTGAFYLCAAAQFLIAIPMSMDRYKDYGILLFGVVTAICFFVPGLKYYLQRLRSRKEQAERPKQET